MLGKAPRSALVGARGALRFGCLCQSAARGSQVREDGDMGLIYRGLRGYGRMVRKSGRSVVRGARHNRYRREREAAYRRHRAAINRDREAFYRRRDAQRMYRAPQPSRPGTIPGWAWVLIVIGGLMLIGALGS